MFRLNNLWYLACFRYISIYKFNMEFVCNKFR